MTNGGIGDCAKHAVNEVSNRGQAREANVVRFIPNSIGRFNVRSSACGMELIVVTSRQEAASIFINRKHIYV